MKRVELKELVIKNWRGIVDLSISFGINTHISAKNGVGKSSILDAYLWLITGKDYFDRSDHEIKPRDSNNEIKRMLESLVKGVFVVNGEVVELTRIYKERWERPNGESELAYRGNTTEYYIDGVKIPKKSDYDEYVANIFNPKIFKTLSQVEHFNGLHWQDQRDILFGLVDVTNEEIIEKNEALKSIVESDIDLEFEKKKIASKKRELNKSIEALKSKYEESLLATPEAKDWDSLQSAKEGLTKELEALNNALKDDAEKASVSNKRKLEIENELYKLRSRLNEIDEEAIRLGSKSRNEKRKKYEDLKESFERKEREYNANKLQLNKLKNQLEIEISEKSELLEAYKKIQAEEFKYDDSEKICPTCSQVWPKKNVDIDEMRSQFNIKKSERVASNVALGKACNARIQALESEIEKIPTTDISVLKTQLDEARKDFENTEILKIDVKPTEVIEINEAINKLESEKLSLNNKDLVDTDKSIESKIKELTNKISGIDKELGTKDLYNKQVKRSEELQDSIKINANELVDIDKSEALIKDFEFTKNGLFESKINALFTRVKFSLFKTQEDGKQVPTCESSTNGVFYSTLNNGDRVLTGLEIIEVIGRVHNISYPVFVDNYEAITSDIKSDFQLVLLEAKRNVNELKVEIIV